MNERIRELAKKAGMWRQHYDIGEESPVKLEKFAELLVQECLLAISKTDVTLEEMPVLVKCHDQVEKHFGIE